MGPNWTIYLLQALPLGATLVGLAACFTMTWRRRHAGYLLGALGFALAAAGIAVNMYAVRLPQAWQAEGVPLNEIGWRLAGYQLLSVLASAAGYLLLLVALVVAGAGRVRRPAAVAGEQPPRPAESPPGSPSGPQPGPHPGSQPGPHQ